MNDILAECQRLAALPQFAPVNTLSMRVADPLIDGEPPVIRNPLVQGSDFNGMNGSTKHEQEWFARFVWDVDHEGVVAYFTSLGGMLLGWVLADGRVILPPRSTQNLHHFHRKIVWSHIERSGLGPMEVRLDLESSASRQHYIDAGVYLYPGESGG